ncbi:MAG: right-handed parallel beta-helix repeat-containing protein [Prevotellaceae bacterium]|jgi:hypothetical protein|nr:right-handed parallel beta-helix repeat-containing protein [Prevotellaceae bacterium]
MKKILLLVSVAFTLMASDCNPDSGLNPQTDKPGQVQNFTATPGDGQVSLSWLPPQNVATVPITGYEVTMDNWIHKESKTAIQLTHTYTGLTNGTSYTFKVRAINANGIGPEGVKTATPSSGGTPPLPSGDGNVGPRANNYDDPATGIYVSPAGNDATADGTIGKPYKSINVALGFAPAGSTIILRNGTYREGRDVRVRRSNITIKSAKGEWGVIDLTTFDAGQQEASGVLFYCEDDDNHDNVVTGCKLQSVEVKGGYYAVCFETTWDWGIMYKPLRKGASNIIIEDCILHHSTDDVVKVKPGCENITIRYNEIHSSGQRWITDPDFITGECNSEGIDNVNGKSMHVHNNYIHDICSNAIYAKGGAEDALIENNLIEKAYGAGIMVGFDTSPDFFSVTTNPSYYENIRGVVRNNLIINAGWEGIGLYASKDAEVYNNTIVNAVCGILKYHSPIYFGVVTQDWANPAGCPPNINPSIHHNIVSQPATYTNRMIDIRYATGIYSFGLSALEGNPKMNNNCYFVSGRNATFTDNRPGSSINNVGLAAWKTHISGEAGTIEVNPALDADYLPTNAQCVGMGITVALKP